MSMSCSTRLMSSSVSHSGVRLRLAQKEPPLPNLPGGEERPRGAFPNRPLPDLLGSVVVRGYEARPSNARPYGP